MIETKSKEYYFLEGGGEMGELTRKYDWAQTSIGPVHGWPQSLRTIVDIILHSDVPMFLWWGDEMIQFYNDAYRPSLGTGGKHPSALGQRGIECWPETWNHIEPLIAMARTGGAIWLQDQFIPISRNGKMDDAYWTFGYSPVRDESGNIAGILVICNETTREVKSRRQVDESERTMTSIVLHAPVGICTLDSDQMRPELVNDIFLKLIGKNRAEFLTTATADMFPQFNEVCTHVLESVIFTGVPFRSREQKIKLMRGGAEEIIYVDIVIEPMKFSKTHGARKLMILAIEVTDKVLARQKIEESEQRYRTLITESTVAIALYYGADFRVQYINDIMLRYWGKDNSVIGKPLAEALPEIRDQPFLDKLAAAFQSGESYTGTEEEAILLAGGKLQPFYFNYIYKPLRDSEGRVYAIHHMAMDVTQQVLAGKKVEQSESILRNIILKAPVAMCILKGRDFVVEIANDRMFRIWGKDPGALINRPLFQGLPEVMNQGFEEILGKVLSTGESYSADEVPLNLPRAGGVEIVHITFLYEAYREPDGNISGVMAVATDVTEQVKARQRVEELVEERTKELAESNRNLRRSNEELAQFAYIASHDLQEPARKITTFTELLQQSITSTDLRTKGLLQKIEHASARMLSLIRDILGYSQLSKERQRASPIDLNHVLESIEDDFELLIHERKATITSDPLPVIEGIPVQINQLFANLISNGLKFVDKERPPAIHIHAERMSQAAQTQLELRPELNYYKISFRDNGIGFNQKNARQIFDIFQRLHGKGEYEGTGIGLAMCKKIAQNHKGDIVAESEEGRGATFHVFLPDTQAENS